jgi:polyisoprenyl-phosphate glycosyltransferase
MIKHIAIVCPVYEDWESFLSLMRRLATLYVGAGIAFHVTVVDDGSLTPHPDLTDLVPPESCIAEMELLRLALNLGHQRAIAVGLSHLAPRTDLDAAIVMDSDGEDRPEDIGLLIAEAHRNPGYAVLAGRAERSEGPVFKLFYALYKALFYLMTGRAISFGNYSLLPMSAVRRLAHMPELWNNLAAAIMRSRLPYVAVPTQRGWRLAGRSKMNLIGLIVHGLSAMSVYTDMIFVRILLAASIIGSLAVLGMAAVAAIRFGTSLAIPGWATTVVGDLVILLLQTLVIVIAATLTVLGGRSQRPIIPMVDARTYVAECNRWRRMGAAPSAPAGTVAT